MAWDPATIRQIAVRKEIGGSKKGKLLFIIFSMEKKEPRKLLFPASPSFFSFWSQLYQQIKQVLNCALEKLRRAVHSFYYLLYQVHLHPYPPSPQMLLKFRAATHMENPVPHLGDWDPQSKQMSRRHWYFT